MQGLILAGIGQVCSSIIAIASFVLAAGIAIHIRRRKGEEGKQEGLREQELFEKRRKALTEAARKLLQQKSPADLTEGRAQLDECRQLRVDIFAVQHEIEKLIRDGVSEGRHRAAAVAILSEAMLGLREAIVRLEICAFENEDDPEDLIEKLQHDEIGLEAARDARRAIGRAKTHIASIESYRNKMSRALRLTFILFFGRRTVSDVAAADLRFSCEEVEQALDGIIDYLRQLVDDRLTSEIAALSHDHLSDEQILARLDTLIGSCIHSQVMAKDEQHPMLRLRIYEMYQILGTYPDHPGNLRWRSLLSCYLGWIELFASNAAHGDEDWRLNRLVAAREAIIQSRYWLIRARHGGPLHSLRLSVINARLKEKFPWWADVPPSAKIERWLRELSLRLDKMG